MSLPESAIDMAESIEIQRLLPSHWDSVRQIYEQGIATGKATFEQSAPSWQEWDAAHLPSCRLVACSSDGNVLGWASLSGISKHQVYAGVAEASIYVAACARRMGVGGRLLSALVSESEASGIWTLQASIFPENIASLELVRRAGFRVVGVRQRIACHNGKWRDTLLLERRSPMVGC